jgi:hypothetical protein
MTEESLRTRVDELQREVKALRLQLQNEQRDRASLLNSRLEKRPSLAMSIISYNKANSPREEIVRHNTASTSFSLGVTKLILNEKKKVVLETPEDFISGLRKSIDLSFLKNLEKKLANEEEGWLLDFIHKDGLKSIVSAIQKIDENPFKKISDVVYQISLVMCIRNLVNHEATLNLLLNEPPLVENFVDHSIRTQNVMLKTKFFDFFGALCLYSPVGWKIIFESFSKVSGRRNPYSFLCGLIKKEEDVQFRRASVFLCNALINGKSSLEDRMAVRQELIRNGLIEVLHQVNDAMVNDLDGPLSSLVSSFFSQMESDQKEKVQIFLFSFFFLLFCYLYLERN